MKMDLMKKSNNTKPFMVMVDVAFLFSMLQYMKLVYDSGSDFEKIIAEKAPAVFQRR